MRGGECSGADFENGCGFVNACRCVGVSRTRDYNGVSGKPMQEKYMWEKIITPILRFQKS